MNVLHVCMLTFSIRFCSISYTVQYWFIYIWIFMWNRSCDRKTLTSTLLHSGTSMYILLFLMFCWFRFDCTITPDPSRFWRGPWWKHAVISCAFQQVCFFCVCVCVDVCNHLISIFKRPQVSVPVPSELTGENILAFIQEAFLRLKLPYATRIKTRRACGDQLNASVL